jgi:DNA-binding HxlR family transcriptional regulator
MWDMATKQRDVGGLGRTQKLVLQLLASNGSLSARELEYHWPTLTESSAYSAVMRLADRGLVDVAGWDQYGRNRSYCLTERGGVAERQVSEVDQLDEDDA